MPPAARRPGPHVVLPGVEHPTVVNVRPGMGVTLDGLGSVAVLGCATHVGEREADSRICDRSTLWVDNDCSYSNRSGPTIDGTTDEGPGSDRNGWLPVECSPSTSLFVRSESATCASKPAGSATIVPMTSGEQIVLVMGQGYVGLPLAMASVDAGFDVIGLDLDERKIKALNAGESYVEDIAAETVQAALASGRYRAITDIADVDGFDVAIISVPTPLKETLPDLSYIESATEAVAAKLRKGNTVILESTTYPGTTEELVAPILEAGSGLEAGVDFHLGYSPERIDPGNKTWTLINTPKVVSGVNEASLAAVKGFFDQVIESTVPASGTREAELTKLLENTFRHVNIALVNELAMFAGDLGINIWDAIDAASSKPFGFMKFTPGPGVGGHCLPVDPSYLSWQVKRSLGTNFRFVELANDVNDHMPDYVVKRIVEILNRDQRSVNGSTVTLLGLSYKKDTGDIRESPSLPIARQLLELGASVRGVDPHLASFSVPRGVDLVDDVEAALTDSHVAVLLVDHSDFDLAAVASSNVSVLDCRHVVDGPNVESL